MEKNTASDILLELLEQGLFSKEVHLPDDTDWAAVLQEASEQSVVGLLKLPDTAPEDVRELYRQREGNRIMFFIRYLYVQDKLHKLLTNAGIPYAILKGCAAAIQYPHPSVRMMGDVDFIVPREYFRECRSLLEKNGYAFLQGEEGDRHISFTKDGISHELHHHFSHDLPVLDRFIDDGLRHITTAEIEGHVFCMLPPLPNGLVLLDHMRSHLRGGMGLRQMIDWMMYVDRYIDDTFWNDGFKDMAQACGLETLAVTATKMCQKYLGLNETITWCKDAEDELCDRLMDSPMLSGNFGRKDERGIIFEATLTRIFSKGLIRSLQSRGKQNWKLLGKYPKLKPFAWLYQIFRYAKRGLQARRGSKLREDLKHSVERTALLKDLKLD